MLAAPFPPLSLYAYIYTKDAAKRKKAVYEEGALTEKVYKRTVSKTKKRIDTANGIHLQIKTAAQLLDTLSFTLKRWSHTDFFRLSSLLHGAVLDSL
jgi:phage-related protein